MIVIPAMDIMGGGIVRLKKGDFDERSEYGLSPVGVAKAVRESGLNHLHFVDLDGARSGSPKNLETLKSIKDNVDISIDFGGGVRTRESLDSVIASGADRVSIGSKAIESKREVREWLDTYPSRLVLSADSSDGKIRINGWKDQSALDVIDFIKEYFDLGFDTVIATDISKDGMLLGPSFSLYERIIKSVPGIRVIASGGIGDAKDLWRLREEGLFGVIVGKALYERRITLEEMSEVENAL